jgi:hypothetical protein
MLRRFAFLAAAVLALTPGTARALDPPPPPDIQPQSDVTPQFALVQVLSQPQIDASWFTEAFLKKMTTAQLQNELTALHANLGSFFSIRPMSDYYDVQFTRGRARARITLVNSQIDSLTVYDQISRATDKGSYRLAQIFQAQPPLPAVLFSQNFLLTYPTAELDRLIAQYKHTYGAYKTVSIAGNEKYLVQFTRGVLGARLHLDENEKIDGLTFEPVASIKP